MFRKKEDSEKFFCPFVRRSLHKSIFGKGLIVKTFQIYGIHLVSQRFRIETNHIFFPFFYHLPTQMLVGKYFFHGIRHTFHIVGIDVNRVFAAGFFQTGTGGSDNRNPCRKSFDNGNSEPLETEGYTNSEAR